MPIRPENRKLYPKDWKQIRQAIQQRAKNRCEKCRVPNYAVGWRDSEGRFHPTGGTAHYDRAGNGELSYREARELVEHVNELPPDDREGRYLVIVCTTAHLKDPDPRNCDPSNLAFLCQACHLAIDRKHHLAVQRRNREARKRQRQPVLFEEGD